MRLLRLPWRKDWRRLKRRLILAYECGQFDGQQENEAHAGRCHPEMYRLGFRHGAAMRRLLFRRMRG